MNLRIFLPIALTAQLSSPIALSAPSSALVHKFNLSENDAVVTNCTSSEGQQERSKIGVRVTQVEDRYFQISIKVKACTESFGFRKTTIDVNVPAQLLDAKSLEETKSDTIVSGVPSTKNPGRANRIRIRKGATENGLIPVTLEWLEGDYLPVKVWVGTSSSVFDGVEGFSTTKSLPWKKIRIQYAHPLLGEALQFSGSLSRVDRE